MESLGIIGQESFALLDCITKLLKAVSEFDAIAIKLESQRDARIARVELGERGLRCRIMRQCNPSLLSQRGPERHADQKIE